MYYDLKKQKWVSDEELRKEIAQDKGLKTIHKCSVCDNEIWCERKEKNKQGCDEEFVLDRLNIYSEAYIKQQEERKRYKEMSKNKKL